MHSARTLLLLWTLTALSCAATKPDRDRAEFWPGMLSVNVIAGGPYDLGIGATAISMNEPGGWGSYWQGVADPLELLYALAFSDPQYELADADGRPLGFSYQRDQAVLGLGTGIARGLGDRVVLYAGAGWAMAYEHGFQSYHDRDFRYKDRTTWHYLTSGLNLSGGMIIRLSPEVALEAGYQSFLEAWYLGLAFPF